MSEFRIGLSGCAGGLDTVSSSELLELAQEAEALGIDALWLNEEHFQGGNLEMDGRRCLSPIVLAAAILARTRRLRVGFSVLLLPLHHPIRLAEEIATLDVLSNGRVDFGISRGRNARYLNGYGISAEDLDTRFQATLQTVLRAWQDGTMDLNGVNHSVEPKPMQRPHPPIFIGTHTDATAAWAAERGYSLICHGITNGDNVERLLRVFRDAGGNAASVPIGRFVYVSESDKSAREELWPAILKLTARLKAFGIPTQAGFLKERDLEPEVFYREMAIAGGPDTCAKRISELRQTWGMEYLNALSAFFGFLPYPYLKRSLRLLTQEVRPRLQKYAREAVTL